MSLSEVLEELYKLHSACIQFDHGVRVEYGREWRLFNPTRFVYAYFTFNSLYNYDWSRTFETGDIWQYEGTGGPSERDKINNLIYTCTGSRDLFESFKQNFQSDLLKHLRDVINPLEELDYIVPDQRVHRGRILNFQRAFHAIYINQLEDVDYRHAVFHLMDLVYNVRNNIFHGTKTINDMLDSRQQTRLTIYTAILLAMNERFFSTAETVTSWRRPRSINRDSVERQSPRLSQVSNSLDASIGMKIPKGILYYPCCGQDTSEPIQQFIQYIDEFHFADVWKIGLPRLRGEARVDAPSRITNVGNGSFVSRYNIKTTNSRLAEIDQESIALMRKLTEQPGHIRNPEIYEETWAPDNADSRPVKIISHKVDGIVTLNALDNISVFYYRGDSPGEGGSGQWWFGPKLFNFVLDKLLDGGLIVTDGSNFDPDHLNVPWKSLRNGGTDFTYRERNFVLLRQSGQRYGPVHIWQVNAIK